MFPRPIQKNPVDDLHPVLPLGNGEGVDVPNDGAGAHPSQLNQVVVGHECSDGEWAVSKLDWLFDQAIKTIAADLQFVVRRAN